MYTFTAVCTALYNYLAPAWPSQLKNSKFLCGHRKGHSPHSTPLGSLYTLLFVVTSAHTLLGPTSFYSYSVIMLSVTSAHTLLGPVSLYSYSVIMLSGLWLFIVTSAGFLLCTYIHLPYITKTLHCVHTVHGSVLWLYIYTSVQPLFRPPESVLSTRLSSRHILPKFENTLKIAGTFGKWLLF